MFNTIPNKDVNIYIPDIVAVIMGGNMTLFETGERNCNNMPRYCMDSRTSMIYTLQPSRQPKRFMASMKSSLTSKYEQVSLKTIIPIWNLFNNITTNI